jgi:hypothetical protein
MRNPQRWVRNEGPFCCGVVVEERQRRVPQRLKNRRERCRRLSWHLRDLRFRRGSPYLVFLPFSPSHRRNSDFGLCEPAWRCIHRRCVGGIRVPCDVDAYSRCMSRGGCLCLAFVQGRCAHSNGRYWLGRCLLSASSGVEAVATNSSIFARASSARAISRCSIDGGRGCSPATTFHTFFSERSIRH